MAGGTVEESTPPVVMNTQDVYRPPMNPSRATVVYDGPLVHQPGGVVAVLDTRDQPVYLRVGAEVQITGEHQGDWLRVYTSDRVYGWFPTPSLAEVPPT